MKINWFKRKKSANIYVTIIAMFVILLGTASVLNFSINDKVNGQQYSRRMYNRYAAESSIDIACNLIRNKLNNTKVLLSYNKALTGNYRINDQSDGYIFDAVDTASDGDATVELTDIGLVTANYMYENGFMEFGSGAEVKVELVMGDFGGKDRMRIAQMCYVAGFNESNQIGFNDDIAVYGKMDDLHFIITTKYSGGEVKASVTMKNLRIGRPHFRELPPGIESGLLDCKLDTTQSVFTIENYQNYAIGS